MDKDQATELTNNIAIADILVRLTALENTLINSGIMSKDKYLEEIKTLSSKVAKSILQKANIPGDLEELIKNINDQGKNN